MGKYYCYARFSSKPQQDGSSEERQLLDYGRKRAAELGKDYVDVYVDRGKSGWTGAHLDGALGRMIEDVRSGKIVPGGEDVIGVEAHNRLSRMPPGDAILQFFGFLKAGITLDIKGNLRTWASINGEQGFGVLVLDLIEMFQAHAESQGKSNMGIKTNRLKREKVRAGERKAMKAGVGWFVGHRCPAWLRPLDFAVDGYLYEIIPEIALVVRRIFAWADSGIGTEVLARRLNDEQTPPLGQHYRTKKPLKNGWSNGTARHLPWASRCMARNHTRIASLVPCRMVPAISDVWYRQRRH